MSLRTRLALSLVMVVVALTASVVIVSRLEREFVYAQIDGQLRAVPRDNGARGPGERPPPARPVTNLYIGRIDASGSRETLLAGQLLDDEPDVPVAAVADAGPRGVTITVDGIQRRHHFRVLAVPRADGSFWSITALPLSATEDALNRLTLTLTLAGTAILAVVALAAWWTVRLGLRPIARLTEAADTIGAGEHGHRVAVDDPRTEAGRLGRAFNFMLDDRDAADARLRQFVADAAHELRTPLTSIRGYLDLHTEGGFPTLEAVDGMVTRLRRESRRMTGLVEDLLLLANLDEQRPLAHDPIDLADVMRDAADDGRAVQPARTLTLDLADQPGDLLIKGDERRLREAVAELVHNALTHTPPDATITLSGTRQNGSVTVTVADDGPGLHADAAARVFDRFYRGDPSRSRPTGGSGLGLAIIQAIAHAHHGTVTLTTAPGRGCAFRLTLPALMRHELPADEQHGAPQHNARPNVTPDR